MLAVNQSKRTWLVTPAILTAFVLTIATASSAQTPKSAVKPAPADSNRKADMSDMDMSGMADNAMSGPMDMNMMKHMLMTPPRRATHEDSVKATKIVADLRQAISKYQDTAVAVADGYKMFLPNVKQRVYHFTNGRRAILAAFKFDPDKPTSILYERKSDGKLHLVGAMYTMPKNASLDRLNARVPLSIGQWHKHVNWCLPKNGDVAAWTQTKDGHPVFGPESPIATKAECDAVHGVFHESLFGWMIHVNVFEGSDLHSIFADDHGAPAPHK